MYDAETELYYLQSRYYDPNTGRFLNADAFTSTGQGFAGNNMFAYCGNNPVNRADPTGGYWEELFVKLHELLKNYSSNCEKVTLPDTTSDSGARFIANYEGFSEKVYYDTNGNATIGYGHLIQPGEKFGVLTEDEALVIFKKDLNYSEGVVLRYMNENGIMWTQQQFDAMVSVAYNSGAKGFRNVANKIMTGWDIQAAFTWYYTEEKARKNGGSDRALWRRRMDEYEIYMFGDYRREFRSP